jgi:hypothetical protein
MAAAAFTQTLVFKGTNGRVMHIPCSVDDVASNFATFPDGNSFLQIPSDANYALIDLIVVTGGTDTNFQEIFANGLSTGLKVSNKSNLNTSNYRQFQQAPVTFKAGSLLRFKESAV